MPKSILILDGEATIGDNLAAYLEDDVFVIQQAESDDHGLHLHHHSKSDGSIVDIPLPGMGGNKWMLKSHSITINP